MPIEHIEVQQLGAQHTAVVRHRISIAEVQRIPGWIGQVYEAIQRAGQQPGATPFVRTLAMDASGMEIEVGWPVLTPFTAADDVQPSTLPGGPAAVATYFGRYEDIGTAHRAVDAWCTEHGHKIAGAPWESYFTDPTTEPDPAKWRTDVLYPLAA